MASKTEHLTFHAFNEGCTRSGWIVSRNPIFADLVAKKFDNSFHRMIESAKISGNFKVENINVYLNNLERVLNVTNLHLIHYVDVCFYGQTKNNMREFQFFDELLSKNNFVVSKAHFLEDFNRDENKYGVDDVIVKNLIDHSRTYLESIDNLTASHIHQHNAFVRSYLATLVSYLYSGIAPPLLAVVANDHSPRQIAYSAAMRDLGGRTVYVQHAEISDTFPPLNFDISILRNQRSVEIYQSIRPINGTYFVLPRSDAKNTSRQAIDMTAENHMFVIIYLSRVFDLSQLNKIIAVLRSNVAVIKVGIKFHPAASVPDEFLNDATLQVFDDPIPVIASNVRHVAIVGTTSAAIVLITHGISVYYLSQIDRAVIGYDSYGFIGSGIIKEITLADLQGAFWKCGFYDEMWLKKAVKFDPTLGENDLENQQKFSSYMQKFLTSTSSTDCSTSAETEKGVWAVGKINHPNLPLEKTTVRAPGLLGKISGILSGLAHFYLSRK